MPLSGLATKIQFTLTADDRTFNRAMKRGIKTVSEQERAMRGLQRRLRGVGTSFNTLRKNVFSFRTALGVATGGGILGAFAKGAIEMGAELQHLAEQTGLNVERFQTLRRVFGNAGVESRQFDRAIRSLNRTYGEALQGTSTYADVFTQLGISLKDTEGNVKDISTVFDELIMATENLTAPERAFALNKLLGETGIRFNGVVQQGIEGIRRLEEEERKLGVVSEESAKKLEALDTRMSQLWNAFRVNVAEGIAQSSDGIDDLLDQLEKTIPDATEAFIELGTLGGKVIETAIENAGALAALFGVNLARKSIPAATQAMIAFGVSSQAAWLKLIGPAGWIIQAGIALNVFGDELNRIFGIAQKFTTTEFVDSLDADASQGLKGVAEEIDRTSEAIAATEKKIKSLQAAIDRGSEGKFAENLEKEKEALAELTAQYQHLEQVFMQLLATREADVMPDGEKPEVVGLPTEEELDEVNIKLKTALEERTEIWQGFWDDWNRIEKEARPEGPTDLEGYIPEVPDRGLTPDTVKDAENYNIDRIFDQMPKEPPPFIKETNKAVEKLGEAFSDLGEFAGDALERIIIQGGDAKDVVKKLLAVIATRFVNMVFGEGGLIRGERQHGGNIQPGQSYQLHKDEVVTPIGAPMNVIPANASASGTSITFAPVFNGVNGPEVEATFNRMRPRLLQDAQQLIANENNRAARRSRVGV